MDKIHSSLVLEILKDGNWIRYGSVTYTDMDRAMFGYTTLKSLPLMKGVTAFRIADYRNFDFTEPYATIP